MRFARKTLVFTALALVAMAHPMGNFSVNHYSRLYFRETGLELTYVLDLAEIPTFQLLGSWQGGSKDQILLDRKTRLEAAEWVRNLKLLQNGARIPWTIQSVTARTSDGAGGMPVLRTVVKAQAALHAGQVSYEDVNFPGRAGWKEVVIDHAPGAILRNANHGSTDISAGLTYYPADPSVTPPQDLSAHAVWMPSIPPVTTAIAEQAAPIAAQAKPTSAPAVTRTASFAQQQPTAPGTVVRGDFLSRMLQRKDLGWGIIGLCLLAAFGLGAMHAMSPGHGKTIVAAYLVGSRGTMKHAWVLGSIVTFTHTFTVFLLGLGVLFFQQYVVPEKIVPTLGAISGLSIVFVGVSLLYRRAKSLMASDHHHRHHHPHSHNHHHDHSHTHGLVHTHDGSTHSHMTEDRITPASLIALGVSGGLVPCPSALILMLSAIALGRPGLGLILLIGFSAGLALVLVAIGMLALYARHLLPDSRKASQSPALRLIPVFSAVVVICLGVLITAVSAGLVQPLRFLS